MILFIKSFFAGQLIDKICLFRQFEHNIQYLITEKTRNQSQLAVKKQNMVEKLVIKDYISPHLIHIFIDYGIPHNFLKGND